MTDDELLAAVLRMFLAEGNGVWVALDDNRHLPNGEASLQIDGEVGPLTNEQVDALTRAGAQGRDQ